MKSASGRDYFAILGVEPSATPEEIRKAYLERAREIHPDRFDFESQPVEWRRANDELARLNEAYAALRGEAIRVLDAERDQDAWGAPRPAGMEPSFADDTAEDAFAFDPGEITRGEAWFGDLPRPAREKLRARQAGLIEDQLRFLYRPHIVNGAVIGLSFCWLAFLFFQATVGEWDPMALMAYSATTVAAGLLMGWNLVGLVKWYRSALKPGFYLTPLYAIRTRFDWVSFTPLWTLHDLSASGFDWRFPFRGVQATLKFPSHREVLHFWSREAFEQFEMQLRKYEKRMRDCLEAGRFELIREQDDFSTVRRRERAATRTGHRWLDISLFGFSFVISVIMLAAAVDLNMRMVQDRLVRHSEPTSTPEAFFTPGQPATLGGAGASLDSLAAYDQSTGRMQQPTGLIPLEDPLKAPGQYSTGQDRASAPHPVLPASSHNPKDLGLPPGTTLYDDAESLGLRFESPSPQPFPMHGHITRFHGELEAVAPLKISLGDEGKHAFVTVEEWETKRPVLTVFIHSGRSVELKVPVGSYRLRYAAGKQWYGEERLFGRDGVYSETDRKLDFTIADGKATGHAMEIGVKPGRKPQ